jgi:eukaryotic-like serine/threonine-protein kinase
MDPERVRAQLDRILVSDAFADADRASRFLRFVVDRALSGRASDVKESIIAVEVLGRNPSSFDSKSDPIVRVEAGRLRDRLNSYYESAGRADRVLIALPKGTYVPEFTERQISLAARTTHPGLLLLGGALVGFALAFILLSYFRHRESTGVVVRLSILPPEGTSFESFAISPDGRKLAFTATLGDKLMLWVRELDSVEAKPLPGTENASQPFWSPDSRSLGFVATPAAKLKTIVITGGPAREIADVVVGCGGTWNFEGVIVFCARPVGGLYEIPATGGMPKPVTSLDASRTEVTHTFPQFLPDGRHFLYLAASSRPGESSIRVGSLGSPESKVLLSADTSAAYAPVLSGHSPSLLFVYQGALMAQPFDSHRLELSGDRAVIVSGIRYQPWQRAKFSISLNGVLVYQTGSAENHQLAWFDRRGKLLQSLGQPEDYFAVSLAPDEKRLALWRDDDPVTIYPMIWMMDLAHGDAVYRFTDTGVAEPSFSPVWSPDGRELLFSRGDDRAMRLLRQPVNGGTAQLVLDTPGPKFPTDWSSDNRFITYGSQWPDYRYMHIWTVLLSGSAEQNKPHAFLQHDYVENGAYFRPTCAKTSPSWMAYASDETGRYEVYVRDFPSGARKWQVSSEGGVLPHWRGDGRELFYMAPDGTLMAVPVNAGGTFQFGASHALFTTGLRFTFFQTYMNEYAVSHDGQRFLFNRRIPETASGAITALISR